MAKQMMISFDKSAESVGAEIERMAKEETKKLGYKVTTGKIIVKIFNEWKAAQGKAVAK